MSATKELKMRAAMALQAIQRGDTAEAERLLENDAKAFMPGPAPDLTAPSVVESLQKAFQDMRRKAGGIPAAMCIIAPQADKPGAFRFHFSGHDAVVALLQGKAGLKVSPTPPPELDANGIKIPSAAAKEKGLQELKEQIEIEEQATPVPVDELAAMRTRHAENNAAATEPRSYFNGLEPPPTIPGLPEQKP
jgi:hypothetical protein